MISRIRSIKRVISAAAGVAATLFMLTAGAAASDKTSSALWWELKPPFPQTPEQPASWEHNGREAGVVIDDEGLVLTIGYLMLEADGAVITGPRGKVVPATVVAYDSETGLGLLRLMQKLNVVPLRLGDSSQLKKQDQVIIASRGGPQPLSAAQVVSRRIFPAIGNICSSAPSSPHLPMDFIAEPPLLVGTDAYWVLDRSW